MHLLLITDSATALVDFDLKVVPGFFKPPADGNLIQPTGVVVNSKGHIFIFNKGNRQLMDFDAENLGLILSNLLANAIKFTPEGGSISLKLVQSFSKEVLEIREKDKGIGISKDHLPFMFDRFY